MTGRAAIRRFRIGRLEVAVMDSISYIGSEHAGVVVVSGSHGGLSSGRYALRHPPRLAVFNDAGVGKDRAGVAALDQLAGFNVAAVAVAAASARIGDGEDTFAHGVIAHLNAPATALGLEPGARLRSELERFGSPEGPGATGEGPEDAGSDEGASPDAGDETDA